jgi:hypothetical protein
MNTQKEAVLHSPLIAASVLFFDRGGVIVSAESPCQGYPKSYLYLLPTHLTKTFRWLQQISLLVLPRSCVTQFKNKMNYLFS